MDGEERTLGADGVASFGQVALSIIVIKGPAAAFALACCPATEPRRCLTGKSRKTLCSDNSGFALESGSRDINQMQK